jgi:hypothetical protein
MESETFSKIKVFKYLNNIHSIIDIGWFMVFTFITQGDLHFGAVNNKV